MQQDQFQRLLPTFIQEVHPMMLHMCSCILYLNWYLMISFGALIIDFLILQASILKTVLGKASSIEFLLSEKAKISMVRITFFC